MTITALLVLALGTYLFRVGPLLAHRRLRLPPAAARPVELGAVALVVALVATTAVFDGTALAGWARPTGVAVAAGAVWRRAPLVVVIVLAAGTAAGLRLLGVP